MVSDITEQKRAEEFELSRQLLVMHFQQSPLGVIQFDLEGRVRDWNPTAVKMFGFSREEAIGQHWTFIVPEPVWASLERVWEELWTRHGGSRSTNDNSTKDGRIIQCEWYNTPLIDPDGKAIAVASLVMDITERKRSEEHVARLHQQNELILCSAAEGILGLDLQGCHTFINPAAARMLGYEVEELLGRPSHSTWHHTKPDGSPYSVEECQICTAYRNGAVHRVSTEVFWSKDGTSFPVEYVSTPIYEQGLMVGSVVTFAEITDRKRAEEGLRRTNELFRSAFEEAPGGMCLVSPEGRFLRVNNAFCLMLEHSESELLAMTFMDATHPEDRSASREWVGRILAGEEVPKTLEKRYLRKSGHVLWGIVGSFLLRSDDGAPLFFITHIQDITARKLAEVEKEKMQSQLQQAMKMEAVGRLAGGVAHDFNNLLTVIMGYSELLLQKIGKESPMHGEVEEIKRAGERAASLTQQLLAFSRKQIIEPKVLLLDSLVAEMHKMLTRLIGEDIALQATTCKSLGPVKVDPGQFQQILMNLVVNARDAMAGGGKIVIETANAELDEGYCALHPYVTPGRYVMLAVSDTGKGMSEEVKAQIFEPFFTTKEIGSGTGLGLATAYGAVKQSGGSIEVYSEVGIGTTIKIFLPRVEEEASRSVKDDRQQDMRGGSETVLLVEDEDIVRNLCVQILERLGYKVMQARNGAEAIALAQGYGDRIDLLLTDVVMPGMNGAELATQLVLHHPEMKVLFTSGYTDDAISRHGILDEGVSFIGKPYTPLALARKVREVLDKA